MQVESRKTKYTKMVLKESLLQLMENKPINKITVTDICKKADLNRGTFYAHYLDAFDLLEQIQNELMEEITEAVDKLVKKNVKSQVILKELFEIILKNKKLCKVVLSDNGDKSFLKDIVNLIKEKIISDWTSNYPYLNIHDLEYLYTYTSTGTIGLIQHWTQSNFKETPLKLSLFLDQITATCLLALINKGSESLSEK
jgi:AcrR family transcriptional regulator